jgi:hypothetical protein
VRDILAKGSRKPGVLVLEARGKRPFTGSLQVDKVVKGTGTRVQEQRVAEFFDPGDTDR